MIFGHVNDSHNIIWPQVERSISNSTSIWLDFFPKTPQEKKIVWRRKSKLGRLEIV